MGRTQGDYQIDITPQKSVEALLEKVGRISTIASAIDNLFFGSLLVMIDRNFNQGLQDKLLDQIRLILTGQYFLNDGGLITLINSIIAHKPITQGTNVATINARLGGFVRATACELGHGQHISLVSPTVLSESAEAYDSFFPNFESVPATTVANACRRSVEDIQIGRVYKVGY